MQATKVIFAVFLVIAVVLQCRDFQNATEVFPIGGFAVFLTLASFSISWSRVNPPLSTLTELKRVKWAGLDLLIATGLPLISGGLLQLAQDGLFKSTPLAMPFLVPSPASAGPRAGSADRLDGGVDPAQPGGQPCG